MAAVAIGVAIVVIVATAGLLRIGTNQEPPGPSTPAVAAVSPSAFASPATPSATSLATGPSPSGSREPGPSSATPGPAAPATPAPASPTPSARPHTAPPASEQPTDGLPVVGGLVVAGSGDLPVATAPGQTSGDLVGVLPNGQTAYVVDGPVVHSGVPWYVLSGLGLLPNTGCEAPYTIRECPTWIGWVAAAPADGLPLLRQVEARCPDRLDYQGLAGLRPIMRIACGGGQALTITAWWAGRAPEAYCIDSPPGVDWLYCALALGGWLAPSPDDVGDHWLAVAVDPASAVVLPEPGRWVDVTGHVDDPASAQCHVVPGNPAADLAGRAQVLDCRSTLVVDAIAATAPSPARAP